MRWVIGLVLLSISNTTAVAQINNWLSPFSGNWHDAHWSAGVLPGTSQTVLITNANSKTVRIGPETVQHFPQSLRIESVTVSAPSNSINQLLIDGASADTPFEASTLYVDEGGDLRLLRSIANGSSLRVMGAVAHDDLSYVSIGTLQLQENGAYDLRSGTLRAGEEHIDGGGKYVGEGEDTRWVPWTGVFNQNGGTNSVFYSVTVNGIYNLAGGSLERRGNGWAALFLKGSGTFNQVDGVVDMPVLLGHGGTYNLRGGLRTGGVMHVWDFGQIGGGRIVQTGGTNAGSFQLTPHIDQAGDAHQSSYTLENGEVHSTSLTIGAYASFVQNGGTHVSDNIILSNRFICRRFQPGRYPECNHVYGRYSLSGGSLVASRIRAAGPFTQNGGSLTVGYLDIAVSTFSHLDGELTVTNIQVTGSFKDGGGTINHRGWIALVNGAFSCSDGVRELGPLSVNSSLPHSCSVIFPTNAGIVRFANSRQMVWSDEARLIVRNWNGSFTGSGPDQLRFGNDADALTHAQVARIYFSNPAGITGLYPARILPDGEVVPMPGVVAEKRGAQLLLNWSPGYRLQTSTNVNGPFEDVPDALSLSPIQFTDPARFFRLKPDSQ